MSNRALCREASHAGSWYTASGTSWVTSLRGWVGGVCGACLRSHVEGAAGSVGPSFSTRNSLSSNGEPLWCFMLAVNIGKSGILRLTADETEGQRCSEAFNPCSIPKGQLHTHHGKADR